MPRKVVGLEQAGLKTHRPLHVILFLVLSIHTKRKSLTLTEFIPALPPSLPNPPTPCPQVCTLPVQSVHTQRNLLATTEHIPSASRQCSFIFSVHWPSYSHQFWLQRPTTFFPLQFPSRSLWTYLGWHTSLHSPSSQMPFPKGRRPWQDLLEAQRTDPNRKCSKCPFPKGGVYGRTFWSPSVQTPTGSVNQDLLVLLKHVPSDSR